MELESPERITNYPASVSFNPTKAYCVDYYIPFYHCRRANVYNSPAKEFATYFAILAEIEWVDAPLFISFRHFSLLFLLGHSTVKQTNLVSTPMESVKNYFQCDMSRFRRASGVNVRGETVNKMYLSMCAKLPPSSPYGSRPSCYITMLRKWTMQLWSSEIWRITESTPPSSL